VAEPGHGRTTVGQLAARLLLAGRVAIRVAGRRGHGAAIARGLPC
jgi:hypothetical protein